MNILFPSILTANHDPIVSLLLLFAFLLALWGAGLIWFQGPDQAWLRLALAAAWLLWLAGCVLWGWRPGHLGAAWGLWLASLAAMLLRWLGLHPSNARDWADDVARPLHMQPLGGWSATRQRLALERVRNFRWRGEEDYDPHWEPRSYDLARLVSVDMAASYWMGPAIAHTLVSFGFDDGEQLVFSIEIRKRRGEQFSGLAGFFRRYELALIAADERDILAVRTNVRGEQVYLYRVVMPQAVMRELFVAYAREAEALRERPRFYNTLTANCTTIVWQLARRVGARLPLDWRLLASGYLPEYLRDLGVLTPGQALEQLRADGDITARAKAWVAPQPMDDRTASIAFSRAIRTGMPAQPGQAAENMPD